MGLSSAVPDILRGGTVIGVSSCRLVRLTGRLSRSRGAHYWCRLRSTANREVGEGWSWRQSLTSEAFDLLVRTFVFPSGANPLLQHNSQEASNHLASPRHGELGAAARGTPLAVRWRPAWWCDHFCPLQRKAMALKPCPAGSAHPLCGFVLVMPPNQQEKLLRFPFRLPVFHSHSGKAKIPFPPQLKEMDTLGRHDQCTTR